MIKKLLPLLVFVCLLQSCLADVFTTASPTVSAANISGTIANPIAGTTISQTNKGVVFQLDSFGQLSYYNLGNSAGYKFGTNGDWSSTNLWGSVFVQRTNYTLITYTNGSSLLITNIGTNVVMIESGFTVATNGQAVTASQLPAFSGGDSSSSAGSVVLTLKNTGTAGTYTKVTFDAQGRETSGTSLVVGDISTNSGTAGQVPAISASGQVVWTNQTFTGAGIPTSGGAGTNTSLLNGLLYGTLNIQGQNGGVVFTNNLNGSSTMSNINTGFYVNSDTNLTTTSNNTNNFNGPINSTGPNTFTGANSFTNQNNRNAGSNFVQYASGAPFNLQPTAPLNVQIASNQFSPFNSFSNALTFIGTNVWPIIQGASIYLGTNMVFLPDGTVLGSANKAFQIISEKDFGATAYPNYTNASFICIGNNTTIQGIQFGSPTSPPGVAGQETYILGVTGTQFRNLFLLGIQTTNQFASSSINSSVNDCEFYATSGDYGIVLNATNNCQITFNNDVFWGPRYSAILQGLGASEVSSNGLILAIYPKGFYSNTLQNCVVGINSSLQPTGLSGSYLLNYGQVTMSGVTGIYTSSHSLGVNGQYASLCEIGGTNCLLIDHNSHGIFDGTMNTNITGVVPAGSSFGEIVFNANSYDSTCMVDSATMPVIVDLGTGDVVIKNLAPIPANQIGTAYSQLNLQPSNTFLGLYNFASNGIPTINAGTNATFAVLVQTNINGTIPANNHDFVVEILGTNAMVYNLPLFTVTYSTPLSQPIIPQYCLTTFNRKFSVAGSGIPDVHIDPDSVTTNGFTFSLGAATIGISGDTNDWHFTIFGY